jgi:hypothetical protein
MNDMKGFIFLTGKQQLPGTDEREKANRFHDAGKT